MTEKDNLVKGVCRIHEDPLRGSLSIYIKKELAEQVALPTKKDLGFVYDKEGGEIRIKKL